MRRVTCLLTLFVIAAFTWAALAAEDPAALLNNLRSSDTETRMAAVEAASRAGAEAVAPLFELMDGENETAALAARLAVQAMVHQAAAPASDLNRAAVSRALVERAVSSQPAQVRTFAIRMLSFVGRDEAVPALAGLLGDPDLGEIARWALVRIPGKASLGALAGAMPGATGDMKIGLVNALGARGAASALPALESAAAADDPAVRAAALQAIARIPTGRSEQFLRRRLDDTQGGDNVTAWDAYVRLAEALLSDRKRGAAAKAFRHAYEAAPAEQLRCAGLIGLGRAGREMGVTAALDALAGPERNLRGAAIEALVAAPGPQATTLIADRMLSCDTCPRALLADVLGRRGDPAAVRQLAAASRDRDKSVRVAATAALGQTGDAAALSALTPRLRDPSREVRDAALASVVRLSTAPAARAEIKALADTSPALRAPLLRVMAHWEAPALLPTFLEAAADSNEQIVVAGLLGITRLLALEIEPAQASRIETGLMRLASGGSPAVKAAALQGYLTIADRRRATEGADTLDMYHRALRLAPDDENRRTALRGIAAIASVDSAPFVEPFLIQGGVMSEAAAAAMPIADKLAQAGDKDKAIELYREVIPATSDRGVLSTAVERLRDLGVEMDIAAETGFITHWWVLGPFSAREAMTTRDVVPTDRAINVNAPVTVDGTPFSWKYVHVADPLGMLDFREAVAPRDDVAAYAYAEVTSDTARDVIFKIGSDDAVVCWLNGKRIHFNDVDRGYGPDQDLVPTRLRSGMNAILMKVLNGGADWAGGLRITDANNVPLRLEQRKQ
ncbi:MAG: HEAT repeat domain-containing protein [Armatimonadota bacterium]|nr:MAG: HEAT repeat domain-containing protein [Armatimonadota bacterium]